jgi:hypothetical protein
MIKGAKAEGVYRGRRASIDAVRVREMKAQGLSRGHRHRQGAPHRPGERLSGAGRGVSLKLPPATGTKGQLAGSEPGKRGKGKKGVSGRSRKKQPDKSAPTLRESVGSKGSTMAGCTMAGYGPTRRSRSPARRVRLL